MDLSTFIIDFEGFKQSFNNFVFKEVAIMVLEEDSIPTVYHFKPPTQWEDLSEEDKCSSRWLERNFHGILYSSGEITYDKLEETLKAALSNAEKIVVKSLQKKKWLQDLLPYK